MLVPSDSIQYNIFMVLFLAKNRTIYIFQITLKLYFMRGEKNYD